MRKIDFDNNKTLYLAETVSELSALQSKGFYAVPVLSSCQEKNSSNPNTDFDINGQKWPFTAYAVTDPDELTTKDFYRIYQRLAGEPWTITTTDRLTIRETTVADVPEFYRIYGGDPSITRYMDELFPNIEDEIEYTRNYISNIYAFYTYGLWTVVENASGRVIGRAGISPIEECDFPDLGFVIDINYQNKGFAFEACNAILNYAKKELEFEIIQARVQPENIPSINLLKKLGFTIPHTPHQGYLVALRTTS